MKNKSRYCPMCKKNETRAECKYGPKIWDMVTIDEEFLPEARKRDRLEAAIFALSMAATGATSPKDFVRLGHIQSPGVAQLSDMMRKRGKATTSGLDNQRVSQPARNRRIENPPTIASAIGKVRGLREGRVHANSPMYPLKSGWTPNEKTKAKLNSLRKDVFGENPNPKSIKRYKSLLAAYNTQSQSSSPSPKQRHVYRLERLHGINVGRERRLGRNSQERVMPSRFKDLPQNKNRNKFYKNLGGAPKPLGEEIDKKTLMMLIIKKLIDEKKRKNYLLNYGYIGEAKTPAWTRNAGKDLVRGGLNKKGIASYRRENPGSKLSMAVTTEPSKLKKGSKKWKRRKSFCARMSGMPGPMKDEKGRPTRKALSLRKWNC